MKKAIAVAIVAAMIAVSTVATFAADTYNFGVYMGPDERDQQLKTVLGAVVKYVAELEKVDMQLKWYNDEKAFTDDAAKGVLDFAYTKNTDPFFLLATKLGYEPILGVSLFDKKTARMCLYSSSDTKITGIDKMKGLRLATYREHDGYYPLRKMFGDKLLDGLFKEVKMNSNGMASLDMLAKKEVDLALVHEMNVFSLKLFNPAMTSKLTELVCSEAAVQPGIMKHKNAPTLLVNRLSSVMESAHTSETLKPYRSLMKTTKIRFFPVTIKDFDPLIKLYTDAAKSGWDKDYEKWLAAAAKK